jgi:hypothetical protein
MRIANEMLDHAYNKDLSQMLLDIGWWRLNWISRRRVKGGVYFILADTAERRGKAEKFIGLLQDLAALSLETKGCLDFVPEIIEVYPRPLAMSTLAGAAQHSFEQQVARLMRDLARMESEGNMREKTIEARAAECDDVIQRAEQYRRFMAESVDEIGAQLAAIKAKFAAGLEAAKEAARVEFDKIDEMAAADKADRADNGNAPTARKGGGRKRVSAADWASKPFDASFFDIEA